MVKAPRSATNPSSRSSRAAGQGLAEYALILAIVAVLSIGTTMYLGKQMSGTFDGIGAALSGVFPGLIPSPAPTAAPDPTPTPDPTLTPPSFYTTKKTCKAAGYSWVTKPKPNHCA